MAQLNVVRDCDDNAATSASALLADIASAAHGNSFVCIGDVVDTDQLDVFLRWDDHEFETTH